MLDSSNMQVLEAALDYASVRQSALSDNIANINTPGYQRKDASFASVLAKANPGSPDLPLDAITDDPRQITTGCDSPSDAVPITTPSGGAMRIDGNNVDMDVEMGRVAKNQIYYQGVAELVGVQFSNLKYVITQSK